MPEPQAVPSQVLPPGLPESLVEGAKRLNDTIGAREVQLSETTTDRLVPLPVESGIFLLGDVTVPELSGKTLEQLKLVGPIFFDTGKRSGCWIKAGTVVGNSPTPNDAIDPTLYKDVGTFAVIPAKDVILPKDWQLKFEKDGFQGSRNASLVIEYPLNIRVVPEKENWVISQETTCYLKAWGIEPPDGHIEASVRMKVFLDGEEKGIDLTAWPAITFSPTTDPKVPPPTLAKTLTVFLSDVKKGEHKGHIEVSYNFSAWTVKGSVQVNFHDPLPKCAKAP